MTKHAYIRSGSVHETFPAAPNWPDDLDVRPCPPEVEPGWTVDEAGAFHAPEAAAVDLVAYARDKRWRVEIGGMTFAGITVATDANSQTKALGARIAAGADPNFTTPWFGEGGASAMLDATALTALSNAMLAHVQGSFVTLASIIAAIDAGTITTPAEIDAGFAAGETT